MQEILLVTEREAAKLLQVSPRTLWTLRNGGKVPFIRVGHQVRYSPEQLREWIKQQMAAVSPA
jgi:excisionase family DNA binding protein